MDLFKILRFYVDKMLKEVPGMKVLVLDEETTQSISMVYSQSEILEQEVFLVEKLESQSEERLQHLKVFLVALAQQLCCLNAPQPCHQGMGSHLARKSASCHLKGWPIWCLAFRGP